MTKAPRKLTDLAKKAIVDDAIEQAYKELGGQHDERDRERIRRRIEGMLSGKASEAPQGSQAPAREAPREDVVLSRGEAARFTVRALDPYGGERGLVETQRNCLVAIYTLDPKGERGVTTGDAYDMMRGAGCKLDYSMKNRASHVGGMFDGLERRGYIKHAIIDARRRAFITDEGREYVSKCEAPVVEQYAKAHENAKKEVS